MLEMMMKKIKELQGHKDSRGLQGILSRGSNVYNSTSKAAQSGSGRAGIGRPPLSAIQRRLNRK